MAMLPFCGYNMGDYFNHWLNIGTRLKHPPKIFNVNWFRLDEEGRFIWPGFGENIRVLKWIIERVHNKVPARETPMGRVPDIKDLDLMGLDIDRTKLEKILEVKPGEWAGELNDIDRFLSQFGTHLPKEIKAEYDNIESRLK
jgi:phosphoenolpyruvate carboxykinase (GTP)